MASTAAVAGFLPSRNGFHFSNWFEPQPTIWLGVGSFGVGIGDAKNGLCGGFCLAVRSRFERGEAPPNDTRSPNRGSPLFDEIVRRQVESFELGRIPLRFLKLMRATDRARANETINRAWPRIRADLDAGRLSMVGLVRNAQRSLTLLGVHHQVLAYGYTLDGDEVRIRVYDPNHPDRDDVELVVLLHRPAPGQPADRAELSQTTGEPLVAILRAG
jgi:hypothetical protein